jgi:hypothetical protein
MERDDNYQYAVATNRRTTVNVDQLFCACHPILQF